MLARIASGSEPWSSTTIWPVCRSVATARYGIGRRSNGWLVGTAAVQFASSACSRLPARADRHLHAFLAEEAERQPVDVQALVLPAGLRQSARSVTSNAMSARLTSDSRFCISSAAMPLAAGRRPRRPCWCPRCSRSGCGCLPVPSGPRGARSRARRRTARGRSTGGRPGRRRLRRCARMRRAWQPARWRQRPGAAATGAAATGAAATGAAATGAAATGAAAESAAGSGCAATVQHQKATSVVQSGRTRAQRKKRSLSWREIPGVIGRLRPAGSRQDRDYRVLQAQCERLLRSRRCLFGTTLFREKSSELPKVSERFAAKFVMGRHGRAAKCSAAAHVRSITKV